MIIDLIDELDVIEGIHKHVSGLDKTENEDVSRLLKNAAKKANDEQWQQLNIWLVQISQDISILLPEIRHALGSGWQGDRILSPELVTNLAK